MKHALLVLIAGTVLSGLAAAYAATTQRMDDPQPAKAEAARTVALD